MVKLGDVANQAQRIKREKEETKKRTMMMADNRNNSLGDPQTLLHIKCFYDIGGGGGRDVLNHY